MTQHNARGQVWSFPNGNEEHLPLILDGEENPSQTAHGHGFLPSLAHLYPFPIMESKTTSLSGSSFHSSKDLPLEECLSSPCRSHYFVRDQQSVVNTSRLMRVDGQSSLSPCPMTKTLTKPPSPRKLGEQDWAYEVPSVRYWLHFLQYPVASLAGKAPLKGWRILWAPCGGGRDGWWNSSLHLSDCSAVDIHLAGCLAPAPSVFQAEYLSVKTFVFSLSNQIFGSYLYLISSLSINCCQYNYHHLILVEQLGLITFLIYFVEHRYLYWL